MSFHYIITVWPYQDKFSGFPIRIKCLPDEVGMVVGILARNDKVINLERIEEN